MKKTLSEYKMILADELIIFFEKGHYWILFVVEKKNLLRFWGFNNTSYNEKRKQ